MRPATPACCLFLFLGLISLGGYSAEPKKTSGDSPPVLISKDGGKAKWANVEQLKQFAARGDPQACFELAERALYGDEVPQDTKQAVLLLEKAAQGGIPNAWFRLGKIYHDGLTGAPDYSRALDYYTRAARAGVPEAQHNIGAMLVSARGVKRDMVEGLAWLIVATKSGAASEAEVQVRDRLAKKPADLKAAGTRAAELLDNLPKATVRAVLKSALPSPVSDESRITPVPVITGSVEKPVIKAPSIDPLVRPEIIPPAAPSIPAPSE